MARLIAYFCGIVNTKEGETATEAGRAVVACGVSLIVGNEEGEGKRDAGWERKRLTQRQGRVPNGTDARSIEPLLT